MIDPIERQAAIDVVRKCPVKEVTPAYMLIDKAEVMTELMMLPPAQPEIIRCRDCKYGEQDEVGRWFCRSLGCQIGNEDGSGFCADAERKTDA